MSSNSRWIEELNIYFLKVKNRSDHQIFGEVVIFLNFKMMQESTHMLADLGV